MTFYFASGQMKTCSLVGILYVICAPVFAAQTPAGDLFSLSITELMNLKVSSVSKREESLSDAAASVYVITNNAIRDAGVTSIPEALRLAPSLQVDRITATRYAISARGFNAVTSNKLLVLIDGRTVYTPLFSGVFWDHQDVVLEDIERIEVISGPGGTLWGSNAVNGVINIITRSSAKTMGTMIGVYGGADQGFGVRYGDNIRDVGHFRIYTKVSGKDSTKRFNGADQFDGSENFQMGFRTDWYSGAGDEFTLQGDTYRGEEEDRGTVIGIDLGAIEVSGGNLLARWKKQFANRSDMRFQVYWDRIKRRDVVLFQPEGEIWDIELQHGVPFDSHRLLWGLGYRRGTDDNDAAFFSTFIPDSRTLEWKNLFIQDEINLTKRFKTNIGLKLEHNDYTGLEYLPSIRLSWSYSSESLLWTALSRAVRAPSRYDRDVYFPAPPNSLVVGGPNFQSEVANILEVGYRGQMSDKLAYSVTAYVHDWDRLRSGSAVPTEFENKIEGEAYGVEFWATYTVNDRWNISMGGFRLHKDLRLKPDSTDPVGVDNATLANDPDYRFSVRSNVALSENFSLQLSMRHSADLPHPTVPSYTSIDANLIWLAHKEVELSLATQNLADNNHREFGEAASSSEFGRMVWLKLLWRR